VSLEEMHIGEQADHHVAQDGANFEADVAVTEADLTMVWANWERAVDELSGAVPEGQARALLIVTRSGALTASRLARALGISTSSASGLCDRMEAAGLLACEPAPGSQREIMLVATEHGRRLASWIRDRRSAVLAQGLESISADGRQALARGLSELAAALG
jgi:DNA-binding MarR family transcriptional regulator